MKGSAPPGPQQPSSPPLALVGGAVAAAPAVYPPAQATHEEVVADRALFMRTLRALHEALGTQFRIPTVSGKELDLHLLYKQVTALGGLEAVIGAKKWTEVSAPFQFPPSFTSKSFTLRKMYSRLLHDYEQVHFHRNAGPPTLPPGADSTKLEGGAAMTSSNPAYKRRRLDAPAAAQLPPSPLEQHHASAEQHAQKAAASAAMPATPPALTAFPVLASLRIPAGSLLGQPLSGSVDAQFDAGYFVTLRIAGKEFKGALYTPPAELVPAASLSMPAAAAAAAGGAAYESPPGRGGAAAPSPGSPAQRAPSQATARRGRAQRRDPAEPKQNKTPFNFFSIAARAKAKAEHPDADQKEISKIVGEMWQRTTPEEKAPYVEEARLDKERYQRALSAYQQQQSAEEADAARAEQAAAAMQHAASLPLSPKVPAPGLEGTPEAEAAWGSPHLSLPTPLRHAGAPRYLPQPAATGPASSPSLDVLLREGAISPREREAAQQMKRLHSGIGTTLPAQGGSPEESPEAPAASWQRLNSTDRRSGADKAPHAAAGHSVMAAAERQEAAAFAASDLEAEREEYEDEGSDGEDV